MADELRYQAEAASVLNIMEPCPYSKISPSQFDSAIDLVLSSGEELTAPVVLSAFPDDEALGDDEIALKPPGGQGTSVSSPGTLVLPYVDNASINPPRRYGSDHNSLTQRTIYWWALAYAALVRWATVLSGIALGLDAAIGPRVGIRLPVLLWWSMVVEVALSVLVGMPYIRFVKRQWALRRITPLLPDERWRVFGELVHTIHPPTDPLACKGNASQGGKRSRKPFNPDCHPHIPQHLGTIFSGWFCDADPADIFEENLKEWFAWSIFDSELHDLSAADHADLTDMMLVMENETGLRLKPGYNGGVRSLRLTLDEIRYSWRPALVYLVHTLLQHGVILLLHACGYTTVRSEDGSVLLHLPKSAIHREPNLGDSEPLTADPSSISPKALNRATGTRRRKARYFAKRKDATIQVAKAAASSFGDPQGRRAAGKNPILFIPGLYVGLPGYLLHILTLWYWTGRPVIVLNVHAMLVHWTSAPPPKADELNIFMRRVWHEYQIPPATGLGHSMGSGILAALVKDRVTTPGLDNERMATVAPNSDRGSASKRPVLYNAVFLDPICFGTVFPDILGNFVYRSRKTWTGLFMRWSASRDINVAHYLYRGFGWSDITLFRSEWVHLVPMMGQEGHAGRPAAPPGRLDEDAAIAHAFSSAPFSTDFGKSRMAVLLAEFDSIINAETLGRYFAREGFTGWRILKGIGHGASVFFPSYWLKVVATIEALGEAMGAEAHYD